MVLGDAVDGTVVHEQFEESLQLQLADGLLVVVDVLAVPDLVLHVLDLPLSRVETHTTHHVSNGL